MTELALQALRAHLFGFTLPLSLCLRNNMCVSIGVACKHSARSPDKHVEGGDKNNFAALDNNGNTHSSMESGPLIFEIVSILKVFLDSKLFQDSFHAFLELISLCHSRIFLKIPCTLL
uniref:Uncharacterized protein n=1 Tax=Romanomermis culicivorax TaxID=13658 RepID=A0A915J841_ROMCU